MNTNRRCITTTNTTKALILDQNSIDRKQSDDLGVVAKNTRNLKDTPLTQESNTPTNQTHKHKTNKNSKKLIKLI
jgi:hypothetical protein